jgi:hypothetical protein
MNQIATIALITIPILLAVYFIYRANQKNAQRVLESQKSLDDSEIWLKKVQQTQAEVISKKETVNPDAHGIAKVDLELKIQPFGGEPMIVTTCWLVEVGSLSQLEPGKSVTIKIDPKKVGRIFPAVPWARAWLFGK